MSEENTNDVIPAVLEEGEAVIPAEKVEEFKAAVEEILQASEEIAEEPVAEEAPKVEEAVEDTNVISSASQNKSKPSDFAAGLTDVANGVIGTGTVKRKPASKKQNEEAKPEKVAVHSTKNVSWPGVGKVLKGYNIVTKDQADQWLTRPYVTLASAEDVAKEFGR